MRLHDALELVYKLAELLAALLHVLLLRGQEFVPLGNRLQVLDAGHVDVAEALDRGAKLAYAGLDR